MHSTGISRYHFPNSRGSWTSRESSDPLLSGTEEVRVFIVWALGGRWNYYGTSLVALFFLLFPDTYRSLTSSFCTAGCLCIDIDSHSERRADCYGFAWYAGYKKTSTVWNLQGKKRRQGRAWYLLTAGGEDIIRSGSAGLRISAVQETMITARHTCPGHIPQQL